VNAGVAAHTAVTQPPRQYLRREWVWSDDVVVKEPTSGRSGAEIRTRLGHPVVDSDAHMLEYLPLLRDFVREEGGELVARNFDAVITSLRVTHRMTPQKRRALGVMRPPWWAFAANSLDRATAMFPALLRSRLDELGIDFAFLYPTHGMLALHVGDADLRMAAARGYNRYALEVCSGVRDRIEPIAAIPAFTPEEALAALDHAVGELGMKAIVVTGLTPSRERLDSLAREFEGPGTRPEFEPFWRECERRDLMPTFHTPAFGFGTRASSTSYVFNHVGAFAAGAEAVARSLLFGGVAARHPGLRFGFMEGGATWAASLCFDVISHLEKRSGTALGRYDPARVDRALIATLLEEYGSDAVRERADRLDAALTPMMEPVLDHDSVDEFAMSGLGDAEAVHRVFREQVFAGCEADDPLIGMAFDGRLGTRQNVGVLFGSDLGHWDAPDASHLLVEAWEQVETGRLTEEQLRVLTFDDPVRAWAGSGLGPFRGTALEGELETRV
jgi:predicted TIM-barrel fold metal-dependent hydrolase